MKDRERLEQERLRNRVGNYHKYMDNALLNNPDPTSSHFLPENDRFNRDFASFEKQQRELAHKQKLDKIEQKRIQKYEMDMKRWEFMEDETIKEQQKLQDRSATGRSNKGGAAFNILSLQYENNKEGEVLKQRDEDNRVRQMLRSKHIDMRNNQPYNVLNGGDRMSIDLPTHKVYNPPDQLKSVGARIMGEGFAGRPLRKDLFEVPKPQSQGSYGYGYAPS